MAEPKYRVVEAIEWKTWATVWKVTAKNDRYVASCHSERTARRICALLNEHGLR